jgi:hypothetical protein
MSIEQIFQSRYFFNGFQLRMKMFRGNQEQFVTPTVTVNSPKKFLQKPLPPPISIVWIVNVLRGRKTVAT